MGVSNQLHDDIAEADVIIAGGGAAGCVVAARLAEADPSLEILIVEGGTNNHNVPNIVHPAFFLDHQLEGSKTLIFYKANKAKELGDRESIVPSGGTLGGGSSVNLMVYTRAQRSDFDAWNTPGWSTDELTPFLRKLETFHGNGEKKTHGSNGPVQVSDGGHRVLKVENDFIQAAEKVGYPEITDLQDLDSNNGVSRWMRYVSPDGKRQDSAHSYLHPLMADGKHSNLHVLVEQKVLRVLFDVKKRACAIEITPNTEYQEQNGSSPIKKIIKARKMVVVSCGACGSPSVLQRSGIGPRNILDRARIPVVVDLPSGLNYQDHNLIFFPYKTNLEPHETNDAIFSGRQSREELITQKSSRLGWNGSDVSGKLRPTEADVDMLGSEFREAWNKDFKNNPNKPVMLISLVSSFLGDHTTVEPGQYVSVACFTAYPYSRGHIHITGPELTDPLDFNLGFFTDPHDIDLKKQIWAYKKHREIMRRTDMYRGEESIGHPQIPSESPAACGGTKTANGVVNGQSHEIKDLEYSTEDDKAIEQFIRENIKTTWHSLGTAKMASREENGVVDANLSVYGVQNLKVVDLSICPENVAANTMNTALVIGEKGADIIIKELGLAA